MRSALPCQRARACDARAAGPRRSTGKNRDSRTIEALTFAIGPAPVLTVGVSLVKSHVIDRLLPEISPIAYVALGECATLSAPGGCK